MKRNIVFIVCVWIVCFFPRTVLSADCYSNLVVSGWLAERDRAEKGVVKAWAKGHPAEELASDIAVILANELYLCSTCRDQADFLKENLHLLNKDDASKVETVPAMILEVILGQDILSPWRQFPSKRKERSEKEW